MGRASGSSRSVSPLANAHLKKVLMVGRWALTSFLAACQIPGKGPGADRHYNYCCKKQSLMRKECREVKRENDVPKK